MTTPKHMDEVRLEQPLGNGFENRVEFLGFLKSDIAAFRMSRRTGFETMNL